MEKPSFSETAFFFLLSVLFFFGSLFYIYPDKELVENAHSLWPCVKYSLNWILLSNSIFFFCIGIGKVELRIWPPILASLFQGAFMAAYFILFKYILFTKGDLLLIGGASLFFFLVIRFLCEEMGFYKTKISKVER